MLLAHCPGILFDLLCEICPFVTCSLVEWQKFEVVVYDKLASNQTRKKTCVSGRIICFLAILVTC